MWSFRTSIAAPDEITINNGAKYTFILDNEKRNRIGKILSDHGGTAWNCDTCSPRLRYSLSNPFNKPDFTVLDNDERAVVVIRRASLMPSRFLIMTDDLAVGQIALKSPLRNKYQVSVDGLSTMVFRMPLFTSSFYGESSSGKNVWAVVGPSKRQWNVLAQPELDDVRLLGALAFIHYQWFYYN